MTSRSELYQRFIDRFDARERRRRSEEAQIESAESAMGVKWPDAYREFALLFGAVYSPSLIDLIVKKKLDYSDVQQFLTPKQTVTETKRWRLEPAGACFAFASDCSGNWFAFRNLPESPRLDDAAVWLFDHETGTVEIEGVSFVEWISRFLTL